MDSEIRSPYLGRSSNKPNVRSIIELFKSLRISDNCSTLQTSPTNLDIVSIILVICLFIGRTIKHVIGLGTSLVPIKSGSGFDTTSRGIDVNTSINDSKDDADLPKQFFALPPISLICPLTVTHQDIELFNHCITLADNPSNSSTTTIPNIKQNPALISLFLASLSEPAMLLLLCKRHCPIRPLGAVNVRNRFEILDRTSCQALVCDQTSSDHHNNGNKSHHPTLIVTARFPQPAKKVRRGLEVLVEVVISTFNADYSNSSSSSNKATTDGKEMGKKDIFKQKFTLLQFIKWQNDKPSQPSLSSNTTTTITTQPDQTPSNNTKSSPPIPSSSSVRIRQHAPLPWSQLSKDYNPIHLSSTLARLLLGSSGLIAHGNHVVAICLHHNSLQNLIESIDPNSNNGKWWMEINFKRPVVLPATVTLTSARTIEMTGMTEMRINDSGDDEKDVKGRREFEIMNQKDGKVVIEVAIGNS